uniref:KIB1-4 beta-propeller domain-containing protein n=1 Tax=Leersia perrieri TaxID=77586 RepID=A0A0D9WK27_9ORYZ
MDGSPPWTTLPDKVVLEIARHIPCAFDRIHVKTICRSWRATLLQFPYDIPPPLPGFLLMRSDADGPTFSCISRGGGWCTHRVSLPDALRRARYFGSYDDSWLFLSVGQRDGHMFFDLNNSQEIDLPKRATLHLDEAGRQFDIGILPAAATLSSSPYSFGCIGAGIFTVGIPPFHESLEYTACRFWRVKSEVIPKVIKPELLEPVMEDVLYRHSDESFNFLTPDEDVHVVRASTASTPYVRVDEVASVGVLKCTSRPDYGDRRFHDQCVVARYLVESSGELLMVIRFAPRPLALASAFQVFQLEEFKMDDGVYQYIWDELPALDGRMLFVGRGCSRSYDVAKYPGLEAGIYFLDDRSRPFPSIPFLDASERQYPCSDNGKWSGTPPRIRRYAPDPDLSEYSPPVWIIPHR